MAGAWRVSPQVLETFPLLVTAYCICKMWYVFVKNFWLIKELKSLSKVEAIDLVLCLNIVFKWTPFSNRYLCIGLRSVSLFIVN